VKGFLRPLLKRFSAIDFGNFLQQILEKQIMEFFVTEILGWYLCMIFFYWYFFLHIFIPSFFNKKFEHSFEYLFYFILFYF
jgi:hypothetical protein